MNTKYPYFYSGLSDKKINTNCKSYRFRKVRRLNFNSRMLSQVYVKEVSAAKIEQTNLPTKEHVRATLDLLPN